MAAAEEVHGREHEQAEPQEEPPSRADEHHVISLTGRRRRFRSEPTWEAWFAESGQCCHRREDCRGNCGMPIASELAPSAEHARGPRRGRGHMVRRPTCNMYEDQLGNLHTDPRCDGVTGTMLEIRQCKVCGV